MFKKQKKNLLTLVLIDPVLVDSLFFRILNSLFGLILFGSCVKIVNFNFLLILCFRIVAN